jgi:hypothetical protein
MVAARKISPCRFEYGQKGGLRQHHLTHHFHALFPFFLLFQQFALAGNVSTVALGGYILAKGRYGGAGDDIAADGALDGDFEHLAGDFIL